MFSPLNLSTRTASLGLLGTALVVGLAAAPVVDLAWRKSDHGRVAKDVSAYFEALTEKEDVGESWESLSETIEKIEKKYENVLTYVEDWEEVFRTEVNSTYRERPRKGKVEEETFEFMRIPIEVAYHFPDSYATKGDSYPLMLIACAPGATPTATLDEWAAPEVRDAAILCAVQMPTGEDLLGALGAPDDPGGLMLLMGAFRTMKGAYAVDMNRVFVAGHDASAKAALYTAAAFPQQFAGVVVRGGGVEIPPTNFRSVASLWQASGEAGTAFEAAAKEAELENVTISAGADAAEIGSWMADKVRDAYPLHVTFAPINERSLSTSWITLIGASDEAGSSLEAKVDPESNTITIDAENVVSVNLSLNDRIVDLSQPVKLVLNGRMQEAQLSRNQRTMIEMMYRGGDWGRVFTVTESFDFGE